MGRLQAFDIPGAAKKWLFYKLNIQIILLQNYRFHLNLL